jgi:hypothetical protein
MVAKRIQEPMLAWYVSKVAVQKSSERTYRTMIDIPVPTR